MQVCVSMSVLSWHKWAYIKWSSKPPDHVNVFLHCKQPGSFLENLFNKPKDIAIQHIGIYNYRQASLPIKRLITKFLERRACSLLIISLKESSKRGTGV